MYNRLSRLSFIIGLFFFITSIIVFVNAMISNEEGNLGKYTGVVFFVFGVFMMLLKENDSE